MLQSDKADDFKGGVSWFLYLLKRKKWCFERRKSEKNDGKVSADKIIKEISTQGAC